MQKITPFPLTIHSSGLRFKAARSHHKPGGMHSDHRSTKVQLWIKIDDLPLKDHEKKLLRANLPPSHLTHNGEIFVEDEEERSQEINRERAVNHANELIKKALNTPPQRIPIEPPLTAEEKRIHEKKMTSGKKVSRKAGFRALKNWLRRYKE